MNTYWRLCGFEPFEGEVGREPRTHVRENDSLLLDG